ncbi:MAG: hypothetical protein JO040_12810 [Gemmatimonadetes bacterium]|nr:hypothetical protein [Gemmatimonadota bacterium]
MSQTCPSCQLPASGRFCSGCGVAIDADCRDCGNHLPQGARFCNQCGAPAVASAAAPVEAVAAPRASNLPWVITGLSLAALIGVVVVPRLREPEVAPAAAAAPFAGEASGSALTGPSSGPAGPVAGPAGNPGAIDLNKMTPREAADRLFNRVMQGVSSGDTAQAKMFLPMAISAYGRVEALDTDGRYHLAVLQLVGGNPQEALKESDQVLAKEPKHLFALFTAAQAEQALGESAKAKELFGRFLGAYDSESKRDLPEYKDHQQALAPMRDEAQRVVSGK